MEVFLVLRFFGKDVFIYLNYDDYVSGLSLISFYIWLLDDVYVFLIYAICYCIELFYLCHGPKKSKSYIYMESYRIVNIITIFII